LAVNLGNKARDVAMKRHDPDKIVQGLLWIYEDIFRQNKP